MAIAVIEFLKLELRRLFMNDVSRRIGILFHLLLLRSVENMFGSDSDVIRYVLKKASQEILRFTVVTISQKNHKWRNYIVHSTSYIVLSFVTIFEYL